LLVTFLIYMTPTKDASILFGSMQLPNVEEALGIWNSLRLEVPRWQLLIDMPKHEVIKMYVEFRSRM